MLGYYPLPGINPRRSVTVKVGVWVPVWVADTAAVLESSSLAVNVCGVLAVPPGATVTIARLNGVLVSSSTTAASAPCAGADLCVAVPACPKSSHIEPYHFPHALGPY